MTYLIKKIWFCASETNNIRNTFTSNRNVHKSLCGPWFWVPKPLYNLSIKGSGAQNRKPHELLRILWFDEKLYLNNIFQPTAAHHLPIGHHTDLEPKSAFFCLWHMRKWDSLLIWSSHDWWTFVWLFGRGQNIRIQL